jgi:hypothetical protein
MSVAPLSGVALLTFAQQVPLNAAFVYPPLHQLVTSDAYSAAPSSQVK